MKHIVFIIITGIFIISCSHQKQNSKNQLYGIWNSVGYGNQLEISKEYATFRDIYKSGCNLNTKMSTSDLEELYTITQRTEDSLQLEVGFTKYYFVRSKKSELCKISVDNPLSNFDALWNTFNENYAFFDLHQINWPQLRDKYRNRLSRTSTDLELYTVLNQMLLELKDGHVSIEIPDSLEDKIEDDEEDSGELREEVIYSINERYIPDHKTYNRGRINWGYISDSISYVQFNDFFELANYNISNDLSSEEFTQQYWIKAEASANLTEDVLESFKKQMGIIYEDIKNSKSCIVDVRFNGGGFDQIGLEILSYFTANRKNAFSKKARLGDGFTRTQNIYIEPGKKTYHGKLYILTSPQTASASETFVLASQNIDNVLRIGSNTEGILSDILAKKLPNGWEYGLSNEVYESTNGVSYEKKGIPADYDLGYTRNTKEFYENLLLELKTNDRAIEKVLGLKK